MNMEPKGYELLKIETKISALEKELTVLFEDLRKYETDDDSKQQYQIAKINFYLSLDL